MLSFFRVLIITFLLSPIFQAYSEVVGRLPQAVSNNAVAAAKNSKGWQIYSFNGLTKDKDWQAVSNTAMGYNVKTGESYSIITVPYSEGRLASIAVTVSGKIYLFGGYTVSAKHEEKSMADVYQFEPESQTFLLFSRMPIPVDDTVALVYKERYIYLISGWHDVGNIGTVQILDTQTKKWFFGTPYPGTPVFGHSAGIIDNQMVINDGVKVTGVKALRRQFDMSAESYLGTIDDADFTQIDWLRLPQHPGKAKYRMAAKGVKSLSQIIFVGGSDNAYNYNGIGYNKIPSEPSNQVFAWDLNNKRWIQHKPTTSATMDHRGMIELGGQLYILGGMQRHQQVSDQVLAIPLQNITQ